MADLHLGGDGEDPEEEEDGHLGGIGQHVHRGLDGGARVLRHVLHKIILCPNGRISI